MNKKEKKILKIFTVIFACLVITFLIIFFNKDNITRKANFVTPEFEVNQILGTPEDIGKDLTYKEMAVKEDYIVFLAATPSVNKDILTIYFTSSEKNTNLLKIRILDSKNNILGESGLIEPNHYLKEIKLSKELKDNDAISIKVMSYKKNTYYSNGSFKLNIFVHKENSNGGD